MTVTCSVYLAVSLTYSWNWFCLNDFITTLVKASSGSWSWFYFYIAEAEARVTLGSPPPCSVPEQGQLWFNAEKKGLFICDGLMWRTLLHSESQFCSQWQSIHPHHKTNQKIKLQSVRFFTYGKIHQKLDKSESLNAFTLRCTRSEQNSFIQKDNETRETDVAFHHPLCLKRLFAILNLCKTCFSASCVLSRYWALGLCRGLSGPLHQLRNLWCRGLLYPPRRPVHGCSQQVLEQNDKAHQEQMCSVRLRGDIHVSSCRDSQAGSGLYRWRDGSFQLYQNITTQEARAWKHFTIDDKVKTSAAWNIPSVNTI